MKMEYVKTDCIYTMKMFKNALKRYLAQKPNHF